MQDDLQVKKDNFLAEIEVMDLAPIKGHQFLVAVGTGDPESVKYLCTTIHGPYTFVEMVQEVGDMWAQHQHHAKAMILSKNADKPVTMLDANTIDYIECHYLDIITEEMLGGAFDDKEFTCLAGLTEADASSDPRLAKKEDNADKQDTLP